jgi:hypothetical protein
VLTDVRNRYVSAQSAIDLYGTEVPERAAG